MGKIIPKRNLYKRLRRGAILLVLAAALALGIKYLWVDLPIGEGPAGPDVPRDAFTEIWTAQPVLMVGLGDSVTASFGARPGYSYFDRLLDNPSDEFESMRNINLKKVLPNLKALNLSVSGSISIEHLEDQIPKLTKQDEDTLGVIVMTTGGNDIIHMYGEAPPREGAMYGCTMEEALPWIQNFETRLETMITKITTAFPGGCHIFLANIYDPSDGVGDPAAAKLPPWPAMLAVHGAYNAVIRRCAARNDQVHLVDMHSAFLGHGVHATQFWRENYRPKDPHYWYYYNLEDPNERGYDAIRRLFLNKMVAVLAEKEGSEIRP